VKTAPAESAAVKTTAAKPAAVKAAPAKSAGSKAGAAEAGEASVRVKRSAVSRHDVAECIGVSWIDAACRPAEGLGINALQMIDWGSIAAHRSVERFTIDSCRSIAAP
jgi:hypothetical protein